MAELAELSFNEDIQMVTELVIIHFSDLKLKLILSAF